MKKSNLKSGMIVEYHNGEKRLVVGDKLIGASGAGVLSDYDDDLKCVGYDILDIIKVYEYKNWIMLDKLLEDDNLELIWERKEYELTDKEIEILKALKTLGYEFLVRDENVSLYAYSKEPYKAAYDWISIDGEYIKVHNDGFDFIAWKDEEPVNINELLKGLKK